ncbi:hypothetical protein LWP59_20545 [Amycolatopsis acidiphila]|uniref:hypothetical protein n=1 Tax=Amycolatopsis acidiphila TaxID=715473 RepID=UPI0019AEF85D|nr:hypothetical protein [Amycolatopsis acidiphila]UIJ56582.1 hypothetical protein LWP59_20545 [Amycolatopsis acidiphila]GHG66546.1 hypothetical protein GCM10017788_24550 [Amycolatopsis acidiphila]
MPGTAKRPAAQQHGVQRDRDQPRQRERERRGRLERGAEVVQHPVPGFGRAAELTRHARIDHRWLAVGQCREQRGERDALPAFERLAQQRPDTRFPRQRTDLGQQPGLADARRPLEHQHLAVRVRHRGQRRLGHGQLRVPPPEGGPHGVRSAVHRGLRRIRLQAA